MDDELRIQLADLLYAANNALKELMMSFPEDYLDDVNVKGAYERTFVAVHSALELLDP